MRQPTPTPIIKAASIHELNTFYHPAAGMSVSSRAEQRNGQWWSLGGLDWRLYLPHAVVTLTTGEDEVLPDLPVVRAGWPFAFDGNEQLEAAA